MDSLRESLVVGHMGLVSMTARRFAKTPDEYSDFVQEGCLGLIRASELYDPDRPTKFSTMAMPWIKKYVRQAAMRRGPVHVPFGVQYTQKRQNAECVKLGMSEPYAAPIAVSLDLVDLPSSISPEEVVIKKVNIEKIEMAFAQLTKTELLVVKLVGMGRGTEEIGKLFQFSKQRASQIFNRAIGKIQEAVCDETFDS